MLLGHSRCFSVRGLDNAIRVVMHINNPNKVISVQDRISEATTCIRYIDPKLRNSKWDLEQIVREYQIAPGKIIPDGRRGKRMPH